jgi:hypothetical protein
MPDWSWIFRTFIPLLTLIILPLVIRKFKKTVDPKIDDLYQHLQGIGIKVFIAEKGSDEGKIGLGGRFSTQKSEGLIELKNSNASLINLVADSNQYGINYYLDYLIKNPNLLWSHSPRKTRLVRKKSSILQGNAINIEWKGDSALVQILNSDYRIKDRLFQGGFESIKGNIRIYPEPKHGYYRIRSSYFLPPRQVFEAIDIIAKHLKSYKL